MCNNDTIEYVTNPLFWTLKTLHLMLAILALAFNVALAFIAIRTIPIGRSLRRVLAASALSHALLSGYVLSKAVHAFLSLAFGFTTLRTAVDTCKLQESPFLLAYLHIAVVCCAFGMERCRVATAPIDKLDDEPRPGDSAGCCLWLVVLLLGSVACTILLLLFGAQATDANVHLAVCNSLIAMRTMLTLCYFCTVLLLHLTATCVYVIVSGMHKRRNHLEPARVLATVKLGKFLIFIIGLWGAVTVLNGCVMILVLTKRIERTSYALFFLLELTFYMLPLIVALVHPLICIWFITPIKQQFVAVLRHDIWAKSELKELIVDEAEIEKPDRKAGVAVRQKIDKSSDDLKKQLAVVEGEKGMDVTSLPSDELSFRTSNASEYLDIVIDLPDEKQMAKVNGLGGVTPVGGWQSVSRQSLNDEELQKLTMPEAEYITKKPSLEY